MCQLEHWLCCVCEDAYVAVNFFCQDVPPGAPACPSATRCERHIASRYCYFCSNVDSRGAPVLSRTPEFLDSLASLEGMLRIAARTDRDDVVLSVYSNWLMGFKGPTIVHPFDSQHPALSSGSTRDHFTRSLSPPRMVTSFHITSSERFEVSTASYQNTNLVDTATQPYIQTSTQFPGPSPADEQFGNRTDKGARRWKNRMERRFEQGEQQGSSSFWSSSFHTPSEDAIYASWEENTGNASGGTRSDTPEHNEGHFSASPTLVDPFMASIPETEPSKDLKCEQIAHTPSPASTCISEVEPVAVNPPTIVFGSVEFSLTADVGAIEKRLKSKEPVTDPANGTRHETQENPPLHSQAAAASASSGTATPDPQHPSADRTKSQKKQNDKNPTSEETKNPPATKLTKNQKRKAARRRKREEKEKLKPESESQPKPDSKPEPIPASKPDPNPKQEQEPKPEPNPVSKPMQKPEEMPVYHQFRVSTLSYRDALNNASRSKASPRSSSSSP
ncbi:hypothetical protein K445DRAFT_365730 [Daldinia sp. EC12]|nr:hypothetical protein K445DRAFT_365730 [Daldinia sp. EC12]